MEASLVRRRMTVQFDRLSCPFEISPKARAWMNVVSVRRQCVHRFLQGSFGQQFFRFIETDVWREAWLRQLCRDISASPAQQRVCHC